SIVAVSVAPELLDKSGRLCLEKAGLISYCHGQYFELGKCLGSFGYSVKKNTKKKKSKTK
ncbi:MAG: flavin reductase family protein, partial [Oscillospiraceae bacterium]|nr:flavin reductase family protein [Oscillospiraceae bacterium]